MSGFIKLIEEKIAALEEKASRIDIRQFEENVDEIKNLIDKGFDKFPDEQTGLLLENFSIRLQKINKPDGLYNEENELKSMFPNKNDPDFDEDSMSYDSVFGDD